MVAIWEKLAAYSTSFIHNYALISRDPVETIKRTESVTFQGMKKSLLSLLVFWLGMSLLTASAEVTETYYRLQDQQLLQGWLDKAQGQVDKNLNRFGLEALKRYNTLSDSLYATEKADTLAKLESTFEKSVAIKTAAIRTNKEDIQKFELERNTARSAFWRLFTKSLLALAVWLGLVFIIIRLRNKRVFRAEAQLAAARLQQDHSNLDERSGKESSSAFQGEINTWEKATGEIRQALEAVTQWNDQLPAGSEHLALAETAKKQLKEQSDRIAREYAILNRFSEQIGQDDSEKTSCSINELCDQAMEIAYRGHTHGDVSFECGVTRDLEKNLQPIPVFPVAATSLFLNVLDNAFLAVKERAASGEKGYKPSVGISTRILPRFLQVRIKDNGNGIPEAIREKVTESFFSTRTEGQGAGIGLSEAERIMKTLHNGELVIESETGRGTDVYIKFYRS